MAKKVEYIVSRMIRHHQPIVHSRHLRNTESPERKKVFNLILRNKRLKHFFLTLLNMALNGCQYDFFITSHQNIKL